MVSDEKQALRIYLIEWPRHFLSHWDQILLWKMAVRGLWELVISLKWPLLSGSIWQSLAAAWLCLGDRIRFPAMFGSLEFADCSSVLDDGIRLQMEYLFKCLLLGVVAPTWTYTTWFWGKWLKGKITCFRADMTAVFLFEVNASEHVAYVNTLHPKGSVYT